MNNGFAGSDFYASLPKVSDFAELVVRDRYHDLPQDWFVGVADVVNSTGEVAAGRYKTVNMVGAAVISAVMNGVDGRLFPFVFGGDGASFAVPAEEAQTVRTALAAVRRWADTEFDIGLRAALVPVSDIAMAGRSVRIARFAVSDGADYAMFDGGGLYWAETEMKAGRYAIEQAPVGTSPDLTGLSCRWAHMPATQGTILSLVLAPREGAPEAEVSRVYSDVIDAVSGLEGGGHPAAISGLRAKWPPKGVRLEAHAAGGQRGFFKAKMQALFESLVLLGMLKTGIVLGGFDARHFSRVVAQNADFRKIDDGLKMTLDCDPSTRADVESILEKAAKAGLINYGISTQDEAMMTCIVPSINTDDHLHFIDGAAGGYTQAAAQMKNR